MRGPESSYARTGLPAGFIARGFDVAGLQVDVFIAFEHSHGSKFCQP